MQNYDPQQDVIPAAPEPQHPVPGTAKAFSIVAFVCGICSLVTLFVGIQFGIAGLVFASLSRRRAGFDLPRNRKGRIMSIIGLIVSVLWLILYIILFVSSVNGIVEDDKQRVEHHVCRARRHGHREAELRLARRGKQALKCEL